MTLESLIEEIENRRKHYEEMLPSMSSHYYEGYSDALGELLEFIEDNK